ncbi:hypothetical protein GmRootA79_46120 [Acidovorax sp. A79]
MSAGDLGYACEEMVQTSIEKDGGTREDAIERLIARGYASETGIPVLIFYAAPGMTVEELRIALKEVEAVAPKDSQVFLERTSKKRNGS